MKKIIIFTSILISMFMFFGCSKDDIATNTDALINATSTDATASDATTTDVDYVVKVVLHDKTGHFRTEKREQSFIDYIKTIVVDDNKINLVMSDDNIEHFKSCFYAEFSDGSDQYRVLHDKDIFYVIKNDEFYKAPEDFNASYYLFINFENSGFESILATSSDGDQLSVTG